MKLSNLTGKPNTWCYKVLVTAENEFCLHEVYFDSDGKFESCTDEPEMFANSLEELQGELRQMLAATENAVVEDDS